MKKQPNLKTGKMNKVHRKTNQRVLKYKKRSSSSLTSEMHLSPTRLAETQSLKTTLLAKPFGKQRPTTHTAIGNVNCYNYVENRAMTTKITYA